MNDVTQSRNFGTTKQEMVEELGERSLLLPALLNRALEANDRAKYLLSLLQTARARADAPDASFPSLRDERLSAGIADPAFDRTVERARRVGTADLYDIPEAGRIRKELVDGVAEMLAPLAAAGLVDAPERARLDALSGESADLGNDRIPGHSIDQMTAARPSRGDSMHLLIMDAHRALNRLQAQIATSTVDGAAVYGLSGDDPDLVAAFMAGVHSTARLKFEHPGLATTATRSGDRLLIQNDLGTTDAHVVVLSAEGLTATLTYSDVHMRRLRFFQSMMEQFDVRWTGTEVRGDAAALGEHHLTTGRFVAPDRPSLERFLRHVGSRLVFVLDWNRARKRLEALLSRDDAIATLRWAAENDLGHMGFLNLGAERLVYDAVELAAKVPARYGEPLSEVLGSEATLAVIRFALRAAAEGLLAGKSPLLIRDEVRVEVLGHVQASHRRLLEAGADHASLIVESARGLRTALVRLGGTEHDEFLQRATARAAAWEHRADEILVAQRQAARRVEGGEALARVLGSADDAIDGLEEAVFLLNLLPDESIRVVVPIIDGVAGITAMNAREHLKALEIACQVVEGSSSDDLEDFLVAVDRVVTLEHQADAADRGARAKLVTEAPEFRSLYVADSILRCIEDASDALMRSVLGLRDHILGSLSS